MTKCCIFDLDGTLLDTLPTIEYYLNKTLAKFGLPLMRDDECRTYVGKGARNLTRRTLEARGVTDEEIYESFFSTYSDDYDKDPLYLTVAYNGIMELLDELIRSGIKLAVLSNKPDFACRAIVSQYFGERFTVAYGGRDGVPLKPAPDALFGIMSELSVSADEVAYIGDSEIDVFTGKAAEIKNTVSVCWGFRTRDELIEAGGSIFVDHPSELLSKILL